MKDLFVFLRKSLNFLLGCILGSFVTFLITPIMNCLSGKALTEKAVYAFAHIAIILLFIIIVIFLMAFIIWLKRRYENKEFDYKYLCPLDSESLNRFFKNIKRNKKEIINESRPDAVWCTEKERYEQIAPEKFFSSEYDKDFETTYLRNMDRKIQYKNWFDRLLNKNPILPTDRCIVECIFIPLDANDNTLLISRGNENHTDIEEKELCLISFSPIPRKFDMKFSPASIYYREVPYSASNNNDIKDLIPIISDIGVLWRFDEKKNTFYLFYAFVAKYEKCNFKREKEINWKLINDLFSVRTYNNKNEENVYFKKDHDKIIGVKTISEIKKDMKEREYLKKRSRLKPIESKIIDWLSVNKI